MKLVSILKQLNTSLSFNIFSFCSYFTFIYMGIGYSYPSFLRSFCELYKPNQIFILFIFAEFILFLGIAIAVIVFLLEIIFHFKISVAFWLENKYINILRYIGFVISFAGFICFPGLIIYLIF